MMSDKLSLVCAKFWTALLSVFVLILFCIIFVIWYGPWCAFRWLTSKLTILFRPDLHKLLDPFAALFLGQGFQNQLDGNLTITIKIAGPVNPAQLLARIEDVFLNSRSENGNPKYAEFKMYPFIPVLWLGYPYWKLESDFKIEEHMRSEIIPTSISNVDEEEIFVLGYENETLKLPHRLEKSPWEITLFTGRHGNSYVIVKFHHCLCDGETIFNLLMKVADNYVPRIKNLPTKSKLFRVWNTITFSFVASYEITENFFRSTPDPPPMTWTLPKKEMSFDTRVIVKSKEIVSCAKVKNVGLKHSVSFTAVLLSAVSGGIHNYLKKKEKPVPESWMVYLPVPLPNHPDSLSNYFTFVPVNLPLGQYDSISRLQTCEKELQKGVQSTAQDLYVFKKFIETAVPRCFSTNKQLAFGFPFALGNFAASTTLVTAQGFPILDMHFKLLQTRWSSVFVALCSYNGGIRIICNADPNIFGSEAQAQEFLDEVINKFNKMFG